MKQSIHFSLREKGVPVKTLDPRAIIFEPVYVNTFDGKSKQEIIEVDWCDPDELGSINERSLTHEMLCFKDA